MAKKYGKPEVISLDHYLHLIDEGKTLLLEEGVADVVSNYRVLQTSTAGDGWCYARLLTPSST